MESIINPHYFLNWLKLQDPERVLGANSSLRCKACPLATFLTEALPFSFARVGAYHFRVGHTGIKADSFGYELPEWAFYFIDMYDTSNDDTAKNAVAIMERLEI